MYLIIMICAAILIAAVVSTHRKYQYKKKCKAFRNNLREGDIFKTRDNHVHQVIYVSKYLVFYKEHDRIKFVHLKNIFPVL